MTTTYFDPATGLPTPAPLPAAPEVVHPIPQLPPPADTNQLVPVTHPLPPRPPPTYGQKQQMTVWKSKARHETEEFNKIRKLVKLVAPEMFKEDAKPLGQPSGIFPQNVAEYSRFKYEMYGMRADELEESAAKTTAMVEAMEQIAKDQRKIKSAFGLNGKVFLDAFSPVLAQPTIWCLQHTEAGPNHRAPWPTKAELLWNGDNRENSHAGTRCGRFLPPPRVSMAPDVPFLEHPIIRPQRMDETGPIFSNGPSPAEAHEANIEMSNDPTFEEEGRGLVGEGLMEEIGEHQTHVDAEINTQMEQMVEQFENLTSAEYVFDG